MAYSPLILKTSPDDYDSIRALLGVSDEEISNGEIVCDPYLPYVEGQVTTVITDYATLAGVDVYFLKTGVECWTAARLCNLLAGKAAAGAFGTTSGGFRLGDYEERGAGAITKMDFSRKAVDLARQAVEALGSISTRVYVMPSPILLAGPTRSGSNIPASIQELLNKVIPDVVEWFE